MKVTVGEEKIVVMSPAFPKGCWGEAAVDWGPYEFPRAGRHPDGRVFVCWRTGHDDFTDIGKPYEWAVSEDDGETWKPFDITKEPAVEALTGAQLPTGEFMQYFTPTNTPIDEATHAELKKLVLVDHVEERRPYEFDRLAVHTVPDGLICKNYRYYVTDKELTKIEVREVEVDFPDMCVMMTPEGITNPAPYCFPRVAPDGTIWQPVYQPNYDAATGKYSRRHACFFLKSTDGGKSFRYVSRIIHDLDFDPEWDLLHEGFAEHDIGFMPDGSMITLMRTGFFTPSYISRSTDGGYTWSKPEKFDYCGTFPHMHTFPNGITVASYGRPGLYIRATDDPSGMKWEDPIEIIPRVYGKDFRDLEIKVNDIGCFNPDIVPINDHELLIVYSDSRYKDEEGFIHKSIRARKISVEV